MSITDELREWAKGSTLSSWTAERLTAIADRIDETHESACAEAYGNGVMSVPIALDESAWVKLPVDADGVPIHFGDMLDQFGTPMTVFAMSDPDPDQGDCMLELITDGISDGTWVRARKMRHHHAPTVEDVLREMLDAWGELPSNATNEAIVAEYAAKLRLAESEEA